MGKTTYQVKFQMNNTVCWDDFTYQTLKGAAKAARHYASYPDFTDVSIVLFPKDAPTADAKPNALIPYFTIGQRVWYHSINGYSEATFLATSGLGIFLNSAILGVIFIPWTSLYYLQDDKPRSTS